MKLFKQLLVAPAALGLLAPVAATAAEFNLDGVNKYASEEQVTSISQFSDVKPTDWAYQALSNLIERYGCVAGYPSGTYKGGKAMTRFEAAALLNACLDRVTDVTDELKKLLAEFEKELAILKGRVDGLEAKVGELEANQFSTTTKLKGIATMTIGGATNGTVSPIANQVTASGATGPGTGPAFNIPVVQAEQVSFNYDVKLILDTSFTGKDLLRTTLRSGNAGGSVFGGSGSALLESYFQQEANGNDTVSIDRLFYQFPVGANFTGTFGAKVGQADMLAMWPSVYGSDTILDRFTLAGANAAYSLTLGAGGGIWYEKDGFSISASYISNEYTAPYSYRTDSELAGGGFGEGSTTTVQVGYAGNNWGAAFAYNYTAANTTIGNFQLIPISVSAINVNGSNNYGFSAYWQSEEAGWIPSISAGFGATSFNGSNNSTAKDTYSWMVGFQWADLFMKGNALGIGLGESNSGLSNFGLEVWYKFQVTDNISVTPAIFWIQNGGIDFPAATTADMYGAVLKTTFKF